jgi:hypothetical protein
MGQLESRLHLTSFSLNDVGPVAAHEAESMKLSKELSARPDAVSGAGTL